MSLLGLVITALSGWVVAEGRLFLGALVFLVGSAFDMLDGDLARLQGTVSSAAPSWTRASTAWARPSSSPA